MRPSALLAALVTLVLAVAVVVAAVDVARDTGPAVEVGNLRLRDVTDRNRAFLEDLDEPVRIVYYASAPAQMPSELRRLERGVVEVLAALRDVAPDRIRFEVVDPAAEAEVLAFATKRRLAPFRVRTVQRDGWTEREVWSTLEIALGARDPAVVNGLLPEHLPRLQSLVCAHLRQLEAPSRPRIAFAAPDGFRGLRALLAERADVLDVDLDGGAPLPDDADLLFWLQPARADEARLAALDAWRREGRGVVLAASARAGGLTTTPEGPALDLAPRGLDVDELWSGFGLRALDAPIFDGRCETLLIDDEAVQVPFLVRCIGPNQDFRRLGDQPNGNLLFASPTPLVLDGDALAERGFEAEVLATSSELSWSLPWLTDEDPAPIPLAQLVPDRGRELPKQPLLVELVPPTSFEGAVVALASASPFADDFLDAAGFAHRRLAGILVDHLTTDERLVMARADFPRPAPLPDLGPTARLGWRAAVVGLGPLLVLLVALARGVLFLERGAARAARRPLGALAATAVAVVALGLLARGVRGGGLDVTAGGINRPSPTAVALAGDLAAAGPLTVEWILTREGDLPPRMRAGARAATRRLADLFDGRAGVRFARVAPEELDGDAVLALGDRGLAPFRVRTTGDGATTVRSVWATLVLRAGERTERLDFPDALAFEDTEFRVAFALWRLRTGATPTVALASDLPRLSPAEAHAEYQQRQLFAPSGTDVYSLARAALERAGFAVVHVDTRPDPGASAHLALPPSTDTVVWLQPRRDATYVLEALANWLHGGGSALVAGQHFRIIPERYRGREFELGYWPQPQSLDLEQHWLPEFGVLVERTVLFDELSFSAELRTKVTRDADVRDYEDQDSALPFLVRASSANFADTPLMEGVGDLALPFPNAIALDADRLAAAGLEAEVLFTTSAASWSFDWKGGDLPPAVLEGPPDGAYEGERPLAVRLRGRFPLPAEALRTSTPEDPAPLAPAPGDGDLVLVGASEVFKNDWILRDGYRGDRLLVNAVAHLALPPELAALAGRRDVPRGLRYVEPERRLAWRALVLGAGPLAVLLVGILARVVAAARARRQIDALEGSG